MNLPNPVIRSHYRNGFIKQYVRDHMTLRTEAASNNVTDYGVNKAIEHLPALRDKLSATNNNYLGIQQDILETFVDRGQLQRLAKPTITATGNAFRASSSTIPDNWPSCTRSYDLPRSRPPTPSAPAKSTRTSLPPSIALLNSTAWPPFDTTSPNSARKALSKSCPVAAATACRPKDIWSA